MMKWLMAHVLLLQRWQARPGERIPLPLPCEAGEGEGWGEAPPLPREAGEGSGCLIPSEIVP